MGRPLPALEANERGNMKTYNISRVRSGEGR